MVKIIIYDEQIAPLYQVLNNKNALDLLNSIQSYSNKPILPKLHYLPELKEKQNLALLSNESFVEYMNNLNSGWIFFYKNLELLYML